MAVRLSLLILAGAVLLGGCDEPAGLRPAVRPAAKAAEVVPARNASPAAEAAPAEPAVAEAGAAEAGVPEAGAAEASATEPAAAEATEPAAAGAAAKRLDRVVSDGDRNRAEGRPASRGSRVRPALRPVDEQRIAAAGIRRVDGVHLVLYTDLAANAEIDGLPRLFDQAVVGYADYFGVARGRLAGWRQRGSIMRDRRLFSRAGLLPNDVRPFHHGFAVGGELWLDDQPTAYYRRHLLLHEGAHAFMEHFLGAGGPAWYREGMAELLGTHAYQDGKLQLAYFPANRAEVPMLGRIKLVQRAVAEGRGLSLSAVLAMDEQAHNSNEPYAWCWAAAVLLDTHPRYRARFRAMARHLTDPAFNDRFRQVMRDDWPQLADQWLVFTGTLEHGHDIGRTAIDYGPGKPLAEHAASVLVAADAGWQNSGLWLEKGTPYRLTAVGRYQVANEPRPWWCEPNGVTLRYYRGRPLGMLLGTVWSAEQSSEETSAFLSPFEVGTSCTIVPKQSGTLHLQINDSPGELHDNQGTIEVTVRPATT